SGRRTVAGAGGGVDRQSARGTPAPRARLRWNTARFRDDLLDMADAARRAGRGPQRFVRDPGIPRIGYRARADRALPTALPRVRRREAGVGNGARQHDGATPLRRYRRREIDLVDLRARRP